MKSRSYISLICVGVLITSLFAPVFVNSQPLSLTPEQIIQYTPFWEGERFPDGRPKVPDSVIERLKYVSVTEAWGILRRADSNVPGQRSQGYINQYVGTLKPMHDDVTICGRTMTAHFMPYRPDTNFAIGEQGAKDGRGRGQYTWGIDQLQNGDVYVVNVCEALLDASHVGDNLGTAIWTKSGNGAIIYGTLRDLEGNAKIEGFNIFVRDFRPESNSNNMMIGINSPIQIGYVTVMPGDIVLAKRLGSVFIPPHYAEMVVNQSERTRLRDKFAHNGVREGRFSARQADGAYTPEMNQEFNQWLKDNKNSMEKFFDDPKAAPPVSVIEDYIREREEGTSR
jgi:4-hydroxy-4-methyl-2-oxoglutarate aldolase